MPNSKGDITRTVSGLHMFTLGQMTTFCSTVPDHGGNEHKMFSDMHSTAQSLMYMKQWKNWFILRWNIVQFLMCHKYIRKPIIKHLHSLNIHQWINQYIKLHFESCSSEFSCIFCSISCYFISLNYYDITSKQLQV